MTSMDNTPDSPAKTPVGYTTQGGNYWTLITPEIWKVLHAVLHQLERNVNRSQNRIESYHQLRSIIAQVGGKKELTGRTDIEIEISNQCARLIANAVIYYNSAILSRLLTKYEASGNAKALPLITQISPTAWRHILLNGHYTFQSDGKMIDLDALVADLDLG